MKISGVSYPPVGGFRYGQNSASLLPPELSRLEKSGAILETVFERISYPKKKPMGKILNLLILRASPETWEAIMKTLPPKTRGLTTKEEKRRWAEREIRHTQDKRDE